MTLTIDLPDDLAQRLRARAAEAGQDINEYAIALFQEATDEEPDPELIAALREGMADLQAGNLLTLEQVDAAVDAAIKAAKTGRNNGHG